MSGSELQKDGHIVIQDDADSKIVQTTLKRSKHGHVTLVRDDTDILVMLQYLSEENIITPLLNSSPKERNVIQAKAFLSMCCTLVLTHYLTGYDSKSYLFGKGNNADF